MHWNHDNKSKKNCFKPITMRMWILKLRKGILFGFYDVEYDFRFTLDASIRFAIYGISMLHWNWFW